LGFGSSLGGGACRGGASFALGLQLRCDPLGRGLFRHGALGLGTLCGSMFLSRALGSGSLGGGALRSEPLGRGALRSETLGCRAFGSALRRGAVRLRALRFRAHLRSQSLGIGAFDRGAFCGGLLCGCAKLLFGASLFRGAAALDRALHRGALLGRATVFLSASLLR
jgi:hypothetical protein